MIHISKVLTIKQLMRVRQDTLKDALLSINSRFLRGWIRQF